MPTLIQHRRPVANPWRLVEDADSVRASLANGDATLVPLALWRTLRDELAAEAASGLASGLASGSASGTTRRARAAVLLEPGDAPAALAPDLARLALVAIRFPSFTDGRGYSAARELRERHGWRGPLMACGDVLRDQLLLLERCGFDTFRLRSGASIEDALAAFSDFSEHYQACAVRAPLFARRAARADAHAAAHTTAPGVAQ